MSLCGLSVVVTKLISSPVTLCLSRIRFTSVSVSFQLSFYATQPLFDLDKVPRCRYRRSYYEPDYDQVSHYVPPYPLLLPV